MGKMHEQDEKLDEKKQSKSLRIKAARFVSDLTAVLLNPISDEASTPPRPSSHDDANYSENSRSEVEEDLKHSVEGPDTSSFPAFLYSLLAPSESKTNLNHQEKVAKDSEDKDDSHGKPSEQIIMRENAKKKSIFSKSRHSLAKAFHQAARISGFRNHVPKGSSDMAISNGSGAKTSTDNGGNSMGTTQTLNNPMPSENLPEISEPSMLLSEKTRSILYSALPLMVHGRKWLLLYSTWKHGISLSTLYRRSMLWPGLSLLVVGDRNGAVFGGSVESPLVPTTRRYQGTNNSFVFTNVSGLPLIFRPTGMNRYFSLCSAEYLAMGGGGHFALYLDDELLSGSSSSSDTYGNPCLAHSEDFEVKEIEVLIHVPHYGSIRFWLICFFVVGSYGVLYMVPSMKRLWLYRKQRYLEYATFRYCPTANGVAL